MTRKPQVRFIRYSATKKFMRCRRSWMLSYMRGLTKARGDAPASGQRDLGTLCHIGVEAIYNGEGGLSAILAEKERHTAAWVATMAAFDSTVTELPKEWAKVYDLALTIIEGYIQHIEEEGYDVGETTIAVEDELQMEVGFIRGDLIILTVHVDRLVQDDITDEFIVEDTKTVQSLDIAQQLQVDNQLLDYALVYRVLRGVRVSRIRHNMLRKVGRTARATPPFYGRVEFPVNEALMQAQWRKLTGVLDDMVGVMQAIEDDPSVHVERCYPHPTRDCSWDCDFLAVCPMMDDGSDWEGVLSDTDLFAPFTPTNHNPESD